MKIDIRCPGPKHLEWPPRHTAQQGVVSNGFKDNGQRVIEDFEGMIRKGPETSENRPQRNRKNVPVNPQRKTLGGGDSEGERVRDDATQHTVPQRTVLRMVVVEIEAEQGFRDPLFEVDSTG